MFKLPLDIALFIEKYGLSAGIILILSIISFPLIRWIVKIDTKIKGHSHAIAEVKESMDSVHTDCHIPVGAVKALEHEVAELKRTDTKLEERFTEQFLSLKREMSGMRDDVKAIYQILLAWKGK